MVSKSIIFLFAFICLGFSGSVVKPTETWVVRATTNTSVPSADYVLDAVECLREAISVYQFGDQIVKFYADLFTQRHPNFRWNVVAGYKSMYLNTDYYVETVLTTLDSIILKDSEKYSDSDIKFIIFNSSNNSSKILK